MNSFGSHSDMICDDSIQLLAVIMFGWRYMTGKVVCQDDFGRYVTETSRIDSGLADSHRFSGRGVGFETEKLRKGVIHRPKFAA